MMETFTGEEIIAAIDIVLSLIILILGGILFFYFKRFFTKKFRPKKGATDTDYVRDIPQDWTPAEMCPLYYYFDKDNVYIDESMSATILDLARRGYLEIYDDGDDKTPTQIKLLNLDKSRLKVHEGILLSMLESVAPIDKVFDMADFETYLQNNQTYAASQIEEYRVATEKKSKDMGLFLTKDPKQKRVNNVGVLLFFLSLILFFIDFVYLEMGMFIWSEVALGILGLLLAGSASRSNRLTKVGEEWYLYFHKLGDYMSDFSSLDEHDVTALTLWDQYMVYATAMGIAEKVAKNMQIAYPDKAELEKLAASSNTTRRVSRMIGSRPVLVTNAILRGTNAMSYATAHVVSRALRATTGKNYGFSPRAMRNVNRIDVAGKMMRNLGRRIGRK